MGGWLQKQVDRLESQRARHLEYLEEADDLEQKIAIERIILDIDQRLIQIAMNAYNNEIHTHQALYR